MFLMIFVWILLGSQDSLLTALTAFPPSILCAQCFPWRFSYAFSVTWRHSAVWLLAIYLGNPMVSHISLNQTKLLKKLPQNPESCLRFGQVLFYFMIQNRNSMASWTANHPNVRKNMGFQGQKTFHLEEFCMGWPPRGVNPAPYPNLRASFKNW